MPRCAVVIEDDADIAALLETALTSQGFEVAIANDGQHGVDGQHGIDGQHRIDRQHRIYGQLAALVGGRRSLARR